MPYEERVSRRRRHPKRQNVASVTPEDVISGRATADAKLLISLIRQTNPTSRQVSKDEAERRYTLKSQLQSMLIENFGDELEVVRDGKDANTVALRHRYEDRTACHTLISELDDDARFWVQQELDRQSVDGEEIGRAQSTKRRNRRTGDQSLVAEGQAALLEYDFETAEECFTEAYQQEGDQEAALALLELWIDTLADYPRAAAFNLSPDADDRLRTLVAIAAAQLGEADQALRLVKGNSSERCVDVYVALGLNAVRAGDRDRAEQRLEDVRRTDPSHPQLSELELQISTIRQDALRPLEERLERIARTDPAESERLAHQIRVDWPESRVAREVLAALSREREEDEVKELLERAEARRRASDFATEADLLGQALQHNLGEQREAIQERLEQAKREAQELSSRRRRAHVETLIESDAAEALGAYLLLADEDRRAIRDRKLSLLFDWLEEAKAARSGGAARAAIAAVIDLESAREQAAAGDLEEAERLLQNERLRNVRDARTLLAETSSQLEQQIRTRAREAFEQVEQSLATRDLEHAQITLAQVPAARLQELERDHWQQLQEALSRETEREASRQQIEQAVVAKRFLRARETVEHALTSERDEGAQKEWQERIAELTDRIQEEWQAETVSDPGDLRSVLLDEHPDSPNQWLTEEGLLYVSQFVLDRVFVWIVDLETGRVKQGVHLRAPEPMTMAAVTEDLFWLVSKSGDIYSLSRSDWMVRGVERLGRSIIDEAVTEEIAFHPASRYAWFLSNARRAYILDRQRERVHRTLDDVMTSRFVPGLEEPALFVHQDSKESRLYEPAGTMTHRHLGPIGAFLCQVVAAPDRDGVILLTIQGKATRLVRLGTSGELTEMEELKGDEFRSQLAAAMRSGLVAVRQSDGHDHWLDLWQLKQKKLVHFHHCDVSENSHLVQDLKGRDVALLCHTAEGVACCALTPASSPQLTNEVHAEDRRFLVSPPPFHCWYPKTTDTGMLELNQFLRGKSPSAVSHWLEGFQEQHRNDPTRLVSLFGIIDHRMTEQRSALLRFLEEEHRSHPLVTLLRAHEAANRNAWTEVLETLSEVSEEEMPGEEELEHRHHLVGHALIEAGRFDEARSVLEAGIAKGKGDCHLDRYLELLKPMPDPEAAEERALDKPAARRLLSAILSADLAFSRSEPQSVSDLLDRAFVWRLREIQSMARFAEAKLSTEPKTPRDKLQKRLVLAVFLATVAEEIPSKAPNLPIGPNRWDETRIADVAQRARDWLDPSD